MTRILLVNDSSLVRQLIGKLLADREGIHIAATAHDGKMALRQLKRQPIDLVLLDVEMPVLDGLKTLEILRQEYPRLPVIMLSRYTDPGAEITVEALLKGAADYMSLPEGAANDEGARAQLKSELIGKIKRLKQPALAIPTSTVARRRSWNRPDVLAIGASTGGPRVLEQLLRALPADLPVPVLVVQHIAGSFVPVLVESLGRHCALPVGIASDGEPLLPGKIWLAPADRHLKLERQQHQLQLKLDAGVPENSCRPAVDVLFRSVSEHYGNASLCVVLTGMGSDGLAGARAVHAAGGRILVQDQASSVVWGMPGAIAQAGLADGVFSLEQLAHEILNHLQTRQEDRLEPR